MTKELFLLHRKHGLFFLSKLRVFQQKVRQRSEEENDSHVSWLIHSRLKSQVVDKLREGSHPEKTRELHSAPPETQPRDPHTSGPHQYVQETRMKVQNETEHLKESEMQLFPNISYLD